MNCEEHPENKVVARQAKEEKIRKLNKILAEKGLGGCETIDTDAKAELIEIYETQAIEAAMFLMGRLNRGQIKRIREANPNMADFYVEVLSR